MTKRNHGMWTLAMMALLLCGLATQGHARDKPRKFKLATLAPKGTTYYTLLQKMAQAWKKAPNGGVRLTIEFLGDCWTEISDATGRRLFFNLGQAGRVVTVTGQEPLSVLLGDADNVSLVVNGRDFAVADADRRGRMARFLLFGS